MLVSFNIFSFTLCYLMFVLANVYKARCMILGMEGVLVNANIPASYHMPLPTAPVPISLEIPPHVTVNPPLLSPLLSPLISPNWQQFSNFGQPTQFVGMLQQPPYMYNTMQSLTSSSGYSFLYFNVLLLFVFVYFVDIIRLWVSLRMVL